MATKRDQPRPSQQRVKRVTKGLTSSEQQVMLAMEILDRGHEKFWSDDIRRLVNEMREGRRISDGTLYKALDRFEAEGWVTANWEPDPGEPRRGRPRVYYRLTETGRRIGAALLEIQKVPELRFIAPAPGWQPK